jgi:hypothetical protein
VPCCGFICAEYIPRMTNNCPMLRSPFLECSFATKNFIRLYFSGIIKRVCFLKLMGEMRNAYRILVGKRNIRAYMGG